MTRLGLVLALVLVLPIGLEAQTPSDTDWAVTTGNAASTRYAPLDQIDASNVAQLERVWTWASPDTALMEGNPKFKSARLRPSNHQASPVKIGDRLFTTSSLYQISSLDPGTGETIWNYDPEAYAAGIRPPNLGFTHRGATYWSDPEGTLPPRLFYATGDAKLRAVDALGGEPIGDFGEAGVVDLTQGLRKKVSQRQYTVSSPVMMCRDVIVVGSSISDAPTHPEAPPGDVRGFDPRTGEQLWTFHSIPQPGEEGHDTWEEGSWENTGNANVWTLMSADEELGLVYLPFGTPTNDWYGGHRKGDNLFAESLVAVDCESGARRWHFQMVHHGLWDYDLPTSTILGDITVDGRRIQAAMQLSKQGFVYVFDRATGEPVWPIEEREVPQTGILGEVTSPTQPFPTKPPPFERQGATLDDLVDYTPEIEAAARKILQQFQYGPLYTPPSTRGTVNMPGWGGGASWPGGAFDPETGMLYVPSFAVPVVMTLKQPDPARSGFDYVGSIQMGIAGPGGLPLFKPPYSQITAYDMSQGEIAWQVPTGNGPHRHPLLRDLDLPPMGSGTRAHVLATKTLLFVTHGQPLFSAPEAGQLDLVGEESLGEFDAILEGQSGGDPAHGPAGSASADDWRTEPNLLSAYDKATGELVWSTELSAHTDGSPITYMHEGKQYLVFAVGGNGDAPEVVAYAVP